MLFDQKVKILKFAVLTRQGNSGVHRGLSASFLRKLFGGPQDCLSYWNCTGTGTDHLTSYAETKHH